jgi:hypothetical protein
MTVIESGRTVRLVRRSLDEGGFSALVSSPSIGAGTQETFAKAG